MAFVLGVHITDVRILDGRLVVKCAQLLLLHVAANMFKAHT
jgi:hypothetical protein